MLPNLADQCLSVSIGHPVLWLDSRFLGLSVAQSVLLGSRHHLYDSSFRELIKKHESHCFMKVTQ